MSKAEVLECFYTFDRLGYAVPYVTVVGINAHDCDPTLVDRHVDCRELEELDS